MVISQKTLKMTASLEASLLFSLINPPFCHFLSILEPAFLQLYLQPLHGMNGQVQS